MTRRAAAIVAAALVLLGLGAFGVRQLLASHTTPAGALTAKPTTCADAYRLLKLTPSQITAGTHVCFTQSLRLSGQLEGAVAQAYQVSADGALPAQPCTEPARWGGYPQAMLAVAVDGKPYRLRISPPGSSEHQALRLSDIGHSVELASILDPAQEWNQVTGSLTVNADGVTGTLSVDALQDVAGATPVHISGQWACGNPPILPSQRHGGAQFWRRLRCRQLLRHRRRSICRDAQVLGWRRELPSRSERRPISERQSGSVLRPDDRIIGWSRALPRSRRRRQARRVRPQLQRRLDRQRRHFYDRRRHEIRNHRCHAERIGIAFQQRGPHHRQLALRRLNTALRLSNFEAGRGFSPAGPHKRINKTRA